MAETKPAHKKELFGHPVGLYILFMTEMWERFSYYGMRAILVLYLVHSTTDDNAGLGWTSAEAFALYGWYTMLVYVACIPGGLIADKLIGQKKTVLIGGITLVAGHTILAWEQMWAFYLGLALIVIGVGMLKANISTMVGGLYEKGDIRRDKGFTIFYIGINLGALLSALSVGYVGEKIGWHYGFGMAGIAMALGLIVYLWGQKYVKNIDSLEEKAEEDHPAHAEDGSPKKKDASLGDLYAELFRSPLQLTVSGILMAFSLYWTFFESIPYGILFVFLTLVIGMMMMIYKELTTQIMRDRYVVMLLTFVLIIVFWGAFEQAGGLMNIYANNKVDRMLSFNLPLIGNEVPATWFQSLNSLFIISFGVLVANFWAKRKIKNREASSLFKMASGIIIMGLGFIFMAGASAQYTAGGEKAAMYWLVFAFLFHTIGELCSSPVSLSFITKLSPMKYASLMMGVYFAATGLGNKLAGVIGETSQPDPTKIEITASQSELKPLLQAKEVADQKEINKLQNDDFIALEDVQDSTFINDEDFTINTVIYPENGEFEAEDIVTGKSLLSYIEFSDPKRKKEVIQNLTENDVTEADPYHANLQFQKAEEEAKLEQYHLGYEGSFIIDEDQTEREFWTFLSITIFTIIIAVIIIFLVKPLKRLTHGVEDDEMAMPEQEGYDISDDKS